MIRIDRELEPRLSRSCRLYYSSMYMGLYLGVHEVSHEIYIPLALELYDEDPEEEQD